MVLGDGSRDRGALADQVSTDRDLAGLTSPQDWAPGATTVSQIPRFPTESCPEGDCLRLLSSGLL
jgi:hypothetical protein